jgi:hypothetical protein
VTWRLVRQVVLLITVAAVGVLAIAPAVASSSDAGGAVGETGAVTIHRVALAPGGDAGEDREFVATVDASDDGGLSWRPAAGEAVTFAYVTDGAGSVVAVNGGPVGSMSCATDAGGHCTITVRTDAPGDAALTASARGQSASVLLP